MLVGALPGPASQTRAINVVQLCFYSIGKSLEISPWSGDGVAYSCCVLLVASIHNKTIINCTSHSSGLIAVTGLIFIHYRFSRQPGYVLKSHKPVSSSVQTLRLKLFGSLPLFRRIDGGFRHWFANLTIPCTCRDDLEAETYIYIHIFYKDCWIV